MKMRKCPGHDDCVIVDDLHTDKAKVGEYQTEVTDQDARKRIDDLGRSVFKAIDQNSRYLKDELTELASVDSAHDVALARLAAGTKAHYEDVNKKFDELASAFVEAEADRKGAVRKERSDAATKDELKTVATRLSDLVDAYTKLSERLDREELAREAGDRK